MRGYLNGAKEDVMLKKMCLIIFITTGFQVYSATIVKIINNSSNVVEMRSTARWLTGNPAVVTRAHGKVERYGNDAFTIAPQETVESYVYIPWKEKNGKVIDEKIYGTVGNNAFEIQEYSVWAKEKFGHKLKLTDKQIDDAFKAAGGLLGGGLTVGAGIAVGGCSTIGIATGGTGCAIALGMGGVALAGAAAAGASAALFGGIMSIPLDSLTGRFISVQQKTLPFVIPLDIKKDTFVLTIEPNNLVILKAVES